MTLDAVWAECLRNDPGFKVPPDAGDSILATFGVGSWLTAWLLSRSPELLALTPRQLVKGLTTPVCPDPYCRKRMLLRIADAEGRTPKRLVWRCYHGPGWHGEPAQIHQREVETIKMPRPKVAMGEILRATRRGATIEYQRPYAFSEPEIVVVEPKRKRHSR